MILPNSYKVRLGFATNSSSSHSIIFRPSTKDDVRWRIGDDLYFGRDPFVLASPQRKLAYLRANLADGLSRIVGWDTAMLIVSALFPGDGEKGIVDHNSVLRPPNALDGQINYEFIRDLEQFVMQPGIVILGGDDNEPIHPLRAECEVLLEYPLVREYPNRVVARKEPSGAWVIFDQKSGNKLRFAFPKVVDGQIVFPEIPEKSATPELVDLKITNFCPFGCSYCYQSSTLRGKHADYGIILSVLFALRSLQVFELAIGGGEPTLHPDFTNIIKHARAHNIVPSFSTRNLAWFREYANRAAVEKHVGRWAYSVDNSDGINYLDNWCSENGFKDRLRPVVHYIVHRDMDDLRRALYLARDSDFNMVLLGYKAVGRGTQDTTKIDPAWCDIVLDAIKDSWQSWLSIDSVLASGFHDELAAVGVPKQVLAPREGLVSMYIDAVSREIGPSSFCPRGQRVPLPKKTDLWDIAIKESFSAW